MNRAAVRGVPVAVVLHRHEIDEVRRRLLVKSCPGRRRGSRCRTAWVTTFSVKLSELLLLPVGPSPTVLQLHQSLSVKASTLARAGRRRTVDVILNVFWVLPPKLGSVHWTMLPVVYANARIVKGAGSVKATWKPAGIVVVVNAAAHLPRPDIRHGHDERDVGAAGYFRERGLWRYPRSDRGPPAPWASGRPNNITTPAATSLSAFMSVSSLLRVGP